MRSEPTSDTAETGSAFAANADRAPQLLRLPTFADERGLLHAADADAGLPFRAARYFVVHEVPLGAVRAQHAQRRGEELLSCIAGSCTVEARWRDGTAVHRLDDPTAALHVPPLVWLECRDFSPDAMLLVLCSLPYDRLNTISDPEEVLAADSGSP